MISIKNKINDKIAIQHLNNLICDKISRKNGKLLKNLINTIEYRRNNLSGKSKKMDKEFKSFLDYIMSKIKESNIQKNIITMTPENLYDKILEIESNYSFVLNATYKIIKLKGKEKINTYRNLLKDIFYYDDYDRWDAYWLAQQLNVNVCPYCNRISTYTLGDTLTKETRPQFDHFFDKARYPYLSLSIYNLVPSCNICNSSYKHSKEFNINDHCHPYIKGFDCENIKFTLEIENVEQLLSVIDNSLNIPKYEIKFKSFSDSVLPKNIEDLGLERLYNYDLSYTDEIIKKSFIYNNDYVESLFKEWEGTLFGSKDEIKNLVMGNYLNIDDIGKRPLGKLTKDITDELRIF